MLANSQITGTKEWATHNINCCLGCSHGCLYCYARSEALRFGRIKSGKDWTTERINQKAVNRTYPKYAGTAMFPTTHDITEGNLDACIIVLRKLLMAGNHVLIVSKPHENIIKLLCHVFQDYKEQILFRFSIGSFDHIKHFWEPNAPYLLERRKSLQAAYGSGFRTSVSMEPLLEPVQVENMLSILSSYVTDTIWIGTANKLRQRTAWIRPAGWDHSRLMARIAELEAWQTTERMRQIYDLLKDNPKIRWKDSYKKALGLEQPEKAGMDI